MTSDTVNWLYGGDFWLRSVAETQLLNKTADITAITSERKIQEII